MKKEELSTTTPPVHSVSELIQQAKILVEQNLGFLWVSGEISNLSQASSGHIYFTLKDEKAQVRCAFFRFQARQTPHSLKNGLAIMAFVRVSLYEPKGDFQLIVQRIDILGEGLLQQRFLQLKNQLAQEGLFDPQYKQFVKNTVQTIGIITSPQAAALHDMLHIMKRRSPSTHIILYPSLVQGEGAASALCLAIERANQRQECELLVITRGGGSLEDLWPFNEERVARSIFSSKLPIVSAVGHEIDFTIADFVADLRAPTPSAAAELITENQGLWTQRYTQSYQRLSRSLQHQLQQLTHRLSQLQRHLKSPSQALMQQSQRLDLAEKALQRAITQQLHRHVEHLGKLAGLLHAISPLQTLDRGYSILFKKGKTVQSVKAVKTGDSITARLKDGELECLVR